MDKCYSTNDETYQDLEDAIEDYLCGNDIEDDSCLDIPMTEADSEPYEHKDFADVSGMIDGMADNACCQAGEWAEDYPEPVSSEKIKELETLVFEWVDKNITNPTFCKVKNIKKVVVKIRNGNVEVVSND